MESTVPRRLLLNIARRAVVPIENPMCDTATSAWNATLSDMFLSLPTFNIIRSLFLARSPKKSCNASKILAITVPGVGERDHLELKFCTGEQYFSR